MLRSAEMFGAQKLNNVFTISRFLQKRLLTAADPRTRFCFWETGLFNKEFFLQQLVKSTICLTICFNVFERQLFFGMSGFEEISKTFISQLPIFFNLFQGTVFVVSAYNWRWCYQWKKFLLFFFISIWMQIIIWSLIAALSNFKWKFVQRLFSCQRIQERFLRYWYQMSLLHWASLT